MMQSPRSDGPARLIPSRLILASASPRRLSLLREAGYEFTVCPADIDEEAAARGLPPADMALQLARLKARAVAGRYPDSVVLAADTVVALGQQILGKPADLAHARWMLGQLSGSTHQVITGVAVDHLAAAIHFSEQVISTVSMRRLAPDEIDAYLASGQWQGKAGGYGLQDPDPFVECIAGCPTNVVGLPMTTTRRLLLAAGIIQRP